MITYKHNTKTKIKIIPYEDKEKCTGVYLMGGNQTDEELKGNIIHSCCRQLDFSEIKEIINILDNSKTFEDIRTLKSTIQIDNDYIQLFTIDE